MRHAAIPESEAVLLVRALGMLVIQAGVYGAGHNVTLNAGRSVFEELARVVRGYGAIEIALKEAQILVNGAHAGLTPDVSRNLAERMALYRLSGILFLTPADLREFLSFVGLFGVPPGGLESQGGFEAALKKANLRSVRAVAVVYQRVSGQKPSSAADEPADRSKKTMLAGPRLVDPGSRPPPEASVLDLSSALADAEPLFRQPGQENENQETESVASAARHARTSALAAMLRDTAAALERGLDQGPDAVERQVRQALDRVRGMLSEWTEDSRRGISMLASHVDEDSKTIASIESAARRRGVGLKLTRQELMERYAELNQEIVQPLTVSSGVIELLKSGRAGGLSEPQRQLLDMAAESVERVNLLVAYLNRLTGLPASFTPDAALLADVGNANHPTI